MEMVRLEMVVGSRLYLDTDCIKARNFSCLGWLMCLCKELLASIGQVPLQFFAVVDIAS